MSKLVNVDRLYSKVLPHVGDKSRIIEELVENSVRAGAKNIDISLSDQGILTCTDDGDGVSDWRSLITVAETGYSRFVEASQNPAGMGLNMLVAASHSVEITSHSDTLFIERAQFFNVPSYRDGLMEKAEAINASPTSGGGCAVKLFLTEGSFKGVRKIVENGMPMWFGYYPVDITFNGVPVVRLSIDWKLLREGEGELAGARIGVGGGVSGVVFWHGKYIKCPELAPFTVEVHSKTPLICPALPDRTRIDNDAGTLESIHAAIEAQLFGDIQAAFNKDDGSYWLSALLYLNREYDVSHWAKWGLVGERFSSNMRSVAGCNIADIDYAYSDHTDITVKHTGGTVEDCELGIAERFGLISTKINNTPMPKAFNDIYHDELVFEVGCDVEENAREYGFGCSVLSFVDEITLNGADVSDVVIELELNYESVVLVADVDAFFDDPELWEYYNSEGVDRHVLESECQRVLSEDKGCVPFNKASELKWAVEAVIGHEGKINQITCDFDKDVVRVVLDDGSEKSIPIG